MIFKRLPRFLVACVLVLSLFVSGCGQTATSSSSTAGKTTSPPSQTTAAKPVSGGQFNKFFPKSQGDYKVTYRQEKSGFSQAKLAQGGEELALLSINDISSNPSAATKFENSSQRISGYPAVTQGKKATAVLVADRYQVKVSSKSDSFSASDREEWLSKFDLQGLSRVK